MIHHQLKKMFSKFTILIFLLSPVLAFAAKGDDEHKVTQVKEFRVNDASSVNINTKYGKVTVHIWNNPVCKANITITGFGNDAEQAKRMTETISIQTKEKDGDVYITAVSDAASKWFSYKKDNKDYVNIDMDIYVPSKLKSINIQNNFGDVLARQLPFPASLKVNYGFIDIAESSSSISLNIAYTNKARLGKMNKVNVNAAYSSLNCEKANEVIFKSSNGTYSFGDIGELNLQSAYDELKFRRVGSMLLRANYTDMKMDELSSSAEISGNYCDIKIRKVGRGFKSLSADINYTDIRFGVQSGTPFRARANVKYGNFSASGFDFKNVSEHREKSSLSYSAITTNASEASPLISVNGKYCDVKVGED